MKKLGVILFVVSIACTSPSKLHQPERSTASLDDHYEQNLRILRDMPLMPGAEVLADDEAEMGEKLVEIFTKIQNESKAKSPNLHRGTHAKGSCFDAKFEVFTQDFLTSQLKQPQDLAQRLLQGIFSTPGQFKSEVRFANAKGQINPDTVGDVRAISFSIDTSHLQPSANGDHRQDFMFNSSPMFAVRNIKEFYELMKAARLAQGDFSYFPNPLYAKAVLNASKLLKQYERNDTLSFATYQYWSNVAYSHGVKSDGSPRDIVKFRITPCDGKGSRYESSAGKPANYLQTDIATRAKETGVCFGMQAQLLDQEKLAKHFGGKYSRRKLSDWVENSGELWDEKVLPFRTVAKLEIPKGSLPRSCDQMALSTRLHSIRDTQPLGSLARVRSVVEETSRARRMGEIK